MNNKFNNNKFNNNKFNNNKFNNNKFNNNKFNNNKFNNNEFNNNVSMDELGGLVKKVDMILDININNFNDDFLVDNFKKICVLRNSNLRTQFNNICKGKQESKEINITEVKQCNKIYLCKEEQIRDIPNLIISLFNKPKKYFIYGTPSNYSFYHSLLLILDKEYILYGGLQKEKKIDDIRNKLVFTLDENYKKFNYKDRKYKKSIMRDNLLNSKMILPQVINYITDYYDICLLIIDTDTYLYSLINEYCIDKNYIIMLRKNNYYQPILNSEGNSKFNYELLDKLAKILKAEFTIDKNIKKNNIVDEILEDKNNFKKESKYKLTELHDIALYYNISIKFNGKNKLKKDLYQEIKVKILI